LTAALAARGLTVRRGGRAVVDAVDLELAAGECLGIAGPNGAGKSTLLAALSGWLPPGQGAVEIGGAPAPRGRVPAGVGYATQETVFYPHLSGRQNLLLFGRLYDLAGQELERRVASVIERFGLGGWADRPAATYSGGIGRRLHLAIAMINQPSVLLLDEPTVGLDPASRRALLQSVMELVEAGTSIVMTSQILADLEVVASRLLVLVEGRVFLQEETQALMARVGTATVVIELAHHQPTGIDLAGLPGVIGFSLHEQVLSVRVRDAAGALPGIIHHLESCRARAARVEVLAPSLEQLLADLVPAL